MRFVGVDSNIMSLAGIAIAIGTMVDMAIIISENVFQRVAETDPNAQLQAGDRSRLIQNAVVEVARGGDRRDDDDHLFLACILSDWQNYRLFALALQVILIAAALIAAVVIVPAMCRICLVKSSKTYAHHGNESGRDLCRVIRFVWSEHLLTWITALMWMIDLVISSSVSP